MLSAVTNVEKEPNTEIKSLSTIDLYNPLPSDDEEDDFEYQQDQDDLELETGDDEDFDQAEHESGIINIIITR